ncbi:hypothetical protein J2S43_001659 [Catenuloplanes nepalensis]|uniref:CHAT domain-containing protein n=1 Tax=Catenuloplanes nepalensis TaxID=587533 RepID=A0ABT9MNX9_9ACTN|nr:CHAT domain-containing protein [Catenuloplanes nepalensis]MDP9793147.1 hypothetical protein [Catenuloplanes nepalensis]
MDPEHEVIYQRCAAAVIRARHDASDADIDVLAADLHQLPDTPRTSALAAGAVQALARTLPTGGFGRLRHLDPLLALAERHPPHGPQWLATRTCARAFSLLWAVAERRVTDHRAALAQLDGIEEEGGGDPEVAKVLNLARTALRHVYALQSGDSSGVHRMAAETAGMAPADPMTNLLSRLTDIATAADRGVDAGPLMARLQADVARLPAGHPMHSAMAEVNTLMGPLLATSKTDGSAYERPSEEQIAAMVAQAERPHATDAERALGYAAAGGALLGAGREPDRRRIDRGVGYFERAVALSPAGDRHRPFHLFGLAVALFRRKEVTGAVADIAAAEPLLTEARNLAGGPHHELWSEINDMLAHAQRTPGNEKRSRDTALDALRRHAYNGLLQTDRRVARKAALDAVDDALSAAHMCLVDADPAAAVRALDGGRALTLFAATRLRHVTALLREANQPGLAERWQAEGGPGAPVELRHDVLEAIATGTDLLDPPSFADIQRALRRVNGDALVYLVPARPPNPGWAVVVPADGRPGYMALPGLRIDTADVDLFLRALRTRNLVADGTRDLGPAHDDGEFRTRLETLSDWAWRAAVGPLLSSGITRPEGRVPHIYLVPMGDLSRVPWHAARPHDGEYAVQRVAFSQTASARMLVDAAGRPAVPLSPTGLVVGDPQTPPHIPDLTAARAEAQAIHRAFYRGGRYVGRLTSGTAPSGAGTVAEVRDWLTVPRPGRGSTLHLACHGFTDTANARSFLQLAPDPVTGESELDATELIDLMGSAPERQVGLVVLAACRTGLAMNGYDDAYSLGTAFLAGGARSVLSTLWSIPDGDTSVLMFMFHHYRVAGRLPVWEALRRAQTWMLDPTRDVPPSMPRPLREQLESSDAGRTAAWAGFVHGGQ